MRRTLVRILQRLQPTTVPRRISTSLSDNQAYPQVCLQAANDYRFFNEFRTNSVYNQILEHVSEQHGGEYLRLIAQDPEVLGAIESFKANDEYGSPRMYSYPGVGKISPTTLRYVKVLVDLRRLFQSLDGFAICEIGVGYGGQCRVINALHRPASYRLVDIQPALGLAQRYLDNYVIPSVLEYQTMNQLREDSYDLVISNYAFTELPRTIQEVYLRKVILRSKRGYITYNEITPPAFRSLKVDELTAIIPGTRILKEEPLSHPRNCIIVWGDAGSGR